MVEPPDEESVDYQPLRRNTLVAIGGGLIELGQLTLLFHQVVITTARGNDVRSVRCSKEKADRGVRKHYRKAICPQFIGHHEEPVFGSIKRCAKRCYPLLIVANVIMPHPDRSFLFLKPAAKVGVKSPLTRISGIT